MRRHPEDVLFGYQLGALQDTEAQALRAHVNTCPRCAGMLAQAGEDLAQLALALTPVQPQSLIRESLMHSLGEINRFTDLLAPLREKLGKSQAETQRVLDRLDDPDMWDGGDLAGVHIHPVENLPGATFVRLTPGTTMPLDQTSSGTVMIIQGSCRGQEGILHNPGDVLDVNGDELADYVAVAGPDLIYLARE